MIIKCKKNHKYFFKKNLLPVSDLFGGFGIEKGGVDEQQLDYRWNSSKNDGEPVS